MNDFGTSPPELINLGTLTIGGAFDMSANSIVENSGTISVGGLMEVLDTSVLQNSGGIALRQGGDFSDHSTITNTGTGTIEVSGGTLNVRVDIANAGQVTIDSSATLKLNDASIDGGTVTNKGTLDLTGDAVLKNGTLCNADQINVSGTGNAFVNETIYNGSSSIPALFYNLQPVVNNALFDDPGPGGSTFTFVTLNTVFVDEIDITGTLTLNGATISGGMVSDNGTIDVTGDSTITGAWLFGGLVTVESGETLTLDGTTHTGSPNITIIPSEFEETPLGSTISPVMAVDPDGVFVSGSTITNDGTIKVDADNGIWLSNVAISGGTIANSGSIEIVGSSSIDNDALKNNQLTVDSSQTLTLDGTTVTGGTVTNYGTMAVDADQTLTLQGGVTVVGGTLSNSGAVDIEGSSGATLDGVTVTGSGDIEVDGAALPASTLVLQGNAIVMDGTLTVGPSGTLAVKTAGGATLNNETVTNNNAIEVFAASADARQRHGRLPTPATIAVDGTGTLTLNDATINGGTINDFSTTSASIVAGDIDVTGSSTISNAHLNNGNVTIASGQTLTLTATR